ncbi:FUSC family protein [Cohnella thermotolerans]|uniref:FUSC family protein n=1 Tax=Cohnella thermotolerans TaxID=329858 RepID=UPI00040746FC|nr:FUSC family protein [Cohnella thermotolerans]
MKTAAAQSSQAQLVSLAATILKMALASGIAWELAKLAGSRHPFLAPVSVILCMQPSATQTLQFSYYRVLGTVIGVVMTALAAIWLPLASWAMALVIVVACSLSLIASRNPTLVREVALSVVLVLALQPQSGTYGFDRVRDTFIGVAVALAVHLLLFPPPKNEQPTPSS